MPSKRETLMKKTVAELKEMAAKKGVTKSGPKAKLVDSLLSKSTTKGGDGDFLSVRGLKRKIFSDIRLELKRYGATHQQISAVSKACDFQKANSMFNLVWDDVVDKYIHSSSRAIFLTANYSIFSKYRKYNLVFRDLMVRNSHPEGADFVLTEFWIYVITKFFDRFWKDKQIDSFFPKTPPSITDSLDKSFVFVEKYSEAPRKPEPSEEELKENSKNLYNSRAEWELVVEQLYNKKVSKSYWGNLLLFYHEDKNADCKRNSGIQETANECVYRMTYCLWLRSGKDPSKKPPKSNEDADGESCPSGGGKRRKNTRKVK